MTTTSAAPCPLHPWIAQPCNICTTTFSVPPAQGEPRNLTRDEQQMLGRALRASAREVTEYREPPTLADAIAAGDGTLHGAIDYWHSRAIRAEAERERLRADAERLDWLDVNWHGAIFGKNERGYLPWADGVDYQPTLRAAIDAARGKP